MAKLSTDAAWEFADAIKQIFTTKYVKRRATVQSVDKDGTIWVQLPGSNMVTPVQTTGANVSPGDVVTTELRGTNLCITENRTDPAIGASKGRSITREIVKPVSQVANSAKTIADEANKVATATGQHFWDDTNGAHVTDVTRNQWEAAVADDFSDYNATTKPYHNLLMNSLGILLRTALKNLVSITKSAIAFYDGEGNNAANIVASFGSSGAQIGLAGESHVEIDYHSLQLVDMGGDTYFYASDLRGADGYATITETFISDGVTDSFNMSAEPYSIGTTSATINDVSVTVDSIYGMTVFLDSPGTAGQTIKITYKTDDEIAKAYTLGVRDANGDVGLFSVAEGKGVVASGAYSHAEGYSTEAEGRYSHSEGNSAIACGTACHAEGMLTQATARGSHSEGTNTVASGTASHAQNSYTVAASSDQTAIGRYNEEDTNGDYALIIGNGTADNARSNAYAQKWDGTHVFANNTTIWDNTSGNTHLLTPEVGTKQAEYSFEGGGLYVRKRTRTSTSAAWGSWSSWTLIG